MLPRALEDAVRDRIRKGWSVDEEGMSLVEIMIAVFVLSVALLALASTAITSIVGLRVSRSRQEATDAASALIENLRRADYSTIALDGGDPLVGTCDGDYDEPIVTTGIPGEAIPREQTFGPSGRISVTTSISWYDEDDDGGCTHGDRSTKRVRVVASWQDKGQTFSVEESTLVSPVDRGLPAPDFRVGTPLVSLSFAPGDVSAEKEKCIGHVVRNLGAEDGYDWSLRRLDVGATEKNGTAGFRTANGDWRARAFFENPAVDPPLNPADYAVPDPTSTRHHANLPSGLEMLLDEDILNGRPETESELASGQQARLWICYTPATGLAVGSSASFEVTVHSQFDENRFETVQHDVRVSKEARVLHLFDDDTSALEGTSGPRVVPGNGGSEIIPVLSMGPPETVQPGRLGTTTSLPNYDTDFDSYPGTQLKDGPRPAVAGDSSWAASSIVFHHQITPGVVFEPDMTLTLWSASESSLAASSAGATTVDPSRLEYRVRLQVLRKNESTVVSTPFDATLAYDHLDVGWQEVPTTFTLPGGALTVGNEQYLRLEITCLPTSEDVCHLAYDHVNFPSSLRVVEQ